MNLKERLEILERPNLPPSVWTGISRRLDEPVPQAPRPIRMRLVLAAAAVLLGAVAGIWRVRAAGRSPRTLSGEPASFVLSAVDLHRERIEGALPFEVCDRSADEIRAWVCGSSGLEAPQEGAGAGGTGRRLECATIVEAGGARAAVFAYDGASRPVTLVTARRSDLSPGGSARAWFSRVRVYRDAARGVTFRSWADAEQAYVLVASSRNSN